MARPYPPAGRLAAIPRNIRKKCVPECALPYRPLRRVDVGWGMLHEFLTSNRTVLIDRCRIMVGSRSDPKATEHELVHGIPTFLDQLIETLTLGQAFAPPDKTLSVRNALGEVASDVGARAAPR